MASLENANENLNQLSNSLGKSVLSVNQLGTALKTLAAVLPIKEVVKIENEYSRLTRTLTLTTKEVDSLKIKMDALSKSTEHYSKETLVSMVANFAKSTSAIALFNKEHDKLTEKFVKTYRQDAPEYLKLFAKLAEEIPSLTTRMGTLSTSAQTLNEVFRKGGREGLSAYLTAIGQLGKETKKTTETLSDSFQKLESAYSNLKTSIGSGGAGPLKSLVDYAAKNPVSAGAGLSAVAGAGASYGLSYLGRTLGLGGGGGGASGGGSFFGQPPGVSYGGGISTGSISTKGLLAGGTLLAAGSVIRGMYGNADESTNAGIASGENKYLGGVGVGIAGGAMVGGALAGPIGAVGGALIELTRQLVNAADVIAENGPGGSTRKGAISAAVGDARERGKRLEYGGYDVVKLGEFNGQEGSAEEALFNAQKSRTFSEGRQRGLYTNLSEEQRTQFLTDRTVANSLVMQNSAQAQNIAGAQYGLETSRFNIGLETGKDVNTGALSKSIEIQIKAARLSEQMAVDDGERAKYQQIILEKEKELSSIGTKTYDQKNKQLQIDLQMIAQRGGSLDQLDETYDKLQKNAEQEAKIYEAAGQTFKMQEKLNQAAEIGVQKAKIRAELANIPLEVEKQRIGLTSRATPSTQIRQGEVSLDQLMNQYNATNDPQELARIRGQLDSQINSVNYQKEFSRPMFQKQLATQGIQARLEGSGGVSGVFGETEILESKRKELEFEILRLKKDQNTEGLAQAEIEKRALDNKIRLNNEYQKGLTTLGHENIVLDSQIATMEALHAPAMAIGKIKQQSLQIAQSQRDILKEQYEREKGVNPDTDMKRREAIAAKEAEIAQKFNYQRRTFAEQFTAQTINMSTGSYLFGNSVSDYARLGSGSYEGSSQMGRRPRGNTYQQQMSATFGQGVDERSSYEQFAKALLGDSDSLSDIFKNTTLKIEGTVSIAGGGSGS